MGLPLPRRRVVPGVLASFEHIDAACDAIRALRKEGRRNLTVYTSHPSHEVEAAVGHTWSPIRLFTLIGGLTGCTAGFSMTLWMSRDWPLVVGGKSVNTVVPYVAIAFELTVLIAGLLTFFGMALLTFPRAVKKVGFDPRFTDDRIGVFVPASAGETDRLSAFFRDAGAVEVRNA
ncbi:MAG TPA: DUF3341 domain-containing protein [Gemmatimonadales bacterium]|jgi:hypothetical protein|nr:DUF3341 domain-containing protein [Gemmatimonadales bacterium]